jgi:hypothetical protein
MKKFLKKLIVKNICYSKIFNKAFNLKYVKIMPLYIVLEGHLNNELRIRTKTKYDKNNVFELVSYDNGSSLYPYIEIIHQNNLKIKMRVIPVNKNTIQPKCGYIGELEINKLK